MSPFIHCFWVVGRAAAGVAKAGETAARTVTATTRRVARIIGPRRPRLPLTEAQIAARHARRRVQARAATALVCVAGAFALPFVPWHGFGGPYVAPHGPMFYGFPQAPLPAFPLGHVLPPGSVVEGREHLPLPFPLPHGTTAPHGEPTPVPEPSSLALFAFALALLIPLRRKRPA